MVPAVRAHAIATRATAVVVLIALLAGCGSSLKSSPTADASGVPEPSAPLGSCPGTVLETLGSVLSRVYREGVASERTATAEHLIAASTPLREAVERDDASATRTAARALLRTGHLTNLLVTRDGHTLAAVGGPALAPLQGTLTGVDGTPLATYTTSVWSDSGFLDEARGVAEGLIALRASDRSVDGSFALAPGPLPNAGTLTHAHVLYQFTSFPAEAYPSGATRIYVLRPARSLTSLCGSTSQDTLVNTLSRVAHLIYAAETGPRRAEQVRRVQQNLPLLEAVAERNPVATEAAIHVLLHEHVVRMRVSATNGELLSDVGGPYVLAPVTAPLRLNGRTIGSVELSIQDDEGYLRLTRRLAGLHVLMYMDPAHPLLVKNSLGPAPGVVPASGDYTYGGNDYRVFTVHAEAFPSGPLTIRVLVPIPYS
jgi:hypothetical protein